MNVQRVDTGSRERLAGFTESSGILPDFPWAERHKAEVCDVPLVLIGGILPPGGSGRARFTESSRIVFPDSFARKTQDEREAACAHERATEASEARMAKRSGRAVNEGPDGRSERPARGQGHTRAARLTHWRGGRFS